MSTTTLTPAQAELLRLLDDGKLRSATELGLATQRSRTSVRSTLLSLNEKGLVKRDLASGSWRKA